MAPQGKENRLLPSQLREQSAWAGRGACRKGRLGGAWVKVDTNEQEHLLGEQEEGAARGLSSGQQRYCSSELAREQG